MIDINGVTPGDTRYGPGFDPPRAEDLPFANLSQTPPQIPCFVAGTLIETETGPLPVEVLRPGDLIRTLDSGLAELRWAGRRVVRGVGVFAPVRIGAGVMGNHRDLWLSPQHRVLISGWRAELLRGEPEVLAAARFLADGGRIAVSPRPFVTYHHLAFDRHEVIWSEGLPTESLHLAATETEGFDAAALAELRALFPVSDHGPAQPTARPCVKAHEGRLLVAA